MDHSGDDWSTRRPTSNIMDYTSPTDDEHETLGRMPSQSYNNRFYPGNGKARATHAPRPRPINTPTSSMTSVPTLPIPIPSNLNVIPGNTLPSAPASPPTPAPSPTPMGRASDWSTAEPDEDIENLDLDEPGQGSGSVGYGFDDTDTCAMFEGMDNNQRQLMLARLLGMCDGKVLGFVANLVGPLLKKDPFTELPNELCLRILTFIEDARTLARSSQVSKRWRRAGERRYGVEELMRTTRVQTAV